MKITRTLATALLAALALLPGHSSAQVRPRLELLVQKNYLRVGEEQCVEFRLLDIAGRRIPVERHFGNGIARVYGPSGQASETLLGLRPLPVEGDLQMCFTVNATGRWFVAYSHEEFGLVDSTRWDVRRALQK